MKAQRRTLDVPRLPTEPDGSSVVVAASGVAWQRQVNGVWINAESSGKKWARSWTDLVMHEGPLELVWSE